MSADSSCTFTRTLGEARDLKNEHSFLSQYSLIFNTLYSCAVVCMDRDVDVIKKVN